MVNACDHIVKNCWCGETSNRPLPPTFEDVMNSCDRIKLHCVLEQIFRLNREDATKETLEVLANGYKFYTGQHDKNARRKEAAQKHPPTQIEVEFYLGMGARQIHEYKQLRDILGVHHSAGMFDVLMRLCSSGYIENNLLKYFKPNEEQTK